MKMRLYINNFIFIMGNLFYLSVVYMSNFCGNFCDK